VRLKSEQSIYECSRGVSSRQNRNGMEKPWAGDERELGEGSGGFIFLISALPA